MKNKRDIMQILNEAFGTEHRDNIGLGKEQDLINVCRDLDLAPDSTDLKGVDWYILRHIYEGLKNDERLTDSQIKALQNVKQAFDGRGGDSGRPLGSMHKGRSRR